MVSEYTTPRAVPYFALNVRDAFYALTPRQRLYAHYMNWAGWAGTPIVAEQLSVESLPLIRTFSRLFTLVDVKTVKDVALRAGVCEADDVDKFLEYVALVYSNMGNYLSFGDSKIIPALDKEAFLNLVRTLLLLEGQAASGNKEECDTILKDMCDLLDTVYDATPSKVMLAFPPRGVSAYYSSNILESEVQLANRFLESKGINGYNTRVVKSEGDGTLHIKIASAAVEEKPTPETFENVNVVVEHGDHAPYLTRVVDNLRHAHAYAENDVQERMLDAYVKHFNLGDIEDHKESQRLWVADKGPVVETNIGFIESYRDPSGVRGEWEGFVAVVDKDQSKKFDHLVQNAETFIARLPWGKLFEKDVFTRPDFTSLKILGFASSGIPAGICIPNYDDVRQNVGFKNVYLDNVVSAINFDVKLNHLSDADWEVYKTGFIPAMSINVGVHELLGHGTGKLFVQAEDGSLNFDNDTVINPLTNQPVSSWYKPGQTWGSLFGGLANAYEECRAEAVALYLGLERDLMAIFGLTTTDDQDRTAHVLWLNMIRAGLVGLEFYSPDQKQWRQAHMRARFCILQKLLRAQNSIVTITHTGGDLMVTIDANRIRTDGRQAIGELLLQLNVNKAVADVAAGTSFFEELTEVSDDFVSIRETVMKLRKPRKQFVQPHTRLNADNTDAELVEFIGSPVGAIEAMVARHKDIQLS